MTVYARPGAEGSVMTYPARYDNFIGGEWVAPAAGRYFENRTPVTGEGLPKYSCLAGGTHSPPMKLS